MQSWPMSHFEWIDTGKMEKDTQHHARETCGEQQCRKTTNYYVA